MPLKNSCRLFFQHATFLFDFFILFVSMNACLFHRLCTVKLQSLLFRCYLQLCFALFAQLQVYRSSIFCCNFGYESCMCILLTDFLIYTEVFLYIMYNSICFFYEYDEIWYQQYKICPVASSAVSYTHLTLPTILRV